MSYYVFKLPDLGEGTVEAEVVAWRVQPGQIIKEDEPLVELMTEKASVEVPSPVGGRIISVVGAPGDRVAVGAELAVFETTAGRDLTGEMPSPEPPRLPERTLVSTPPGVAVAGDSEAVARSPPVATSPAIRRRAREEDVDLAAIQGSGPSGRIMREDIERYIHERSGNSTLPSQKTGKTATPEPPMAGHARLLPSSLTDLPQEVKIIGLRRVIAERMSATLGIPHFSYVEEVDVTELESLRMELNAHHERDGLPFTLLPFVVCALVRALRRYPQCNAVHDAERGVLWRHRAVHVGIATQTNDGLKVPVLRDAQARSLEQIAAEIKRLSEAARANKASPQELTGSTITVTSLGKLGGIASTPIINPPELAIIGVNRAADRPVVRGGTVAIRRLMNLSSSFDHRFIDGHDAAALIRELKRLLEHPAIIFMD